LTRQRGSVLSRHRKGFRGPKKRSCETTPRGVGVAQKQCTRPRNSKSAGMLWRPRAKIRQARRQRMSLRQQRGHNIKHSVDRRAKSSWGERERQTQCMVKILLRLRGAWDRTEDLNNTTRGRPRREGPLRYKAELEKGLTHEAIRDLGKTRY